MWSLTVYIWAFSYEICFVKYMFRLAQNDVASPQYLLFYISKILSSILRKPLPIKPLFDSLSLTFLAKLDESTSKI